MGSCCREVRKAFRLRHRSSMTHDSRTESIVGATLSPDLSLWHWTSGPAGARCSRRRTNLPRPSRRTPKQATPSDVCPAICSSSVGATCLGMHPGPASGGARVSSSWKRRWGEAHFRCQYAATQHRPRSPLYASATHPSATACTSTAPLPQRLPCWRCVTQSPTGQRLLPPAGWADGMPRHRCASGAASPAPTRAACRACEQDLQITVRHPVPVWLAGCLLPCTRRMCFRPCSPAGPQSSPAACPADAALCNATAARCVPRARCHLSWRSLRRRRRSTCRATRSLAASRRDGAALLRCRPCKTCEEGLVLCEGSFGVVPALMPAQMSGARN